MTSLLIETEQLKKQPENTSLVLIDVRSIDDYRHAHIPGAVHFDLSQFNHEEGSTVGLLPNLENFNRAVAMAGISHGHHVVVYDNSAGPPAARFAWSMKAFGFDDISILNGGIQAWQKQSLPVSDDIPEVKQGLFSGKLQTDRIADYDYIHQRLATNELVIIDARSAAEYAGEDVRSAHGGHIPSAIHIDWTDTKQTGQSNLFQPREALKQLFETVDPTKEVVSYCQSHQRSTVICLLLEELGYKHVRGYPGAWSDWGNRQDAPIEK